MSEGAAEAVSERRRKPIQKRSRAMVEKVLESTRELLRQEGIDSLTTDRVAAHAGVAVGTVYRYFPNKQAMIYAIYEELLDYVQETFDRFEDEEHQSLPRDVFFERLLRELKTAELHDNILGEIARAMVMFPQLEELDIAHGRELAVRVARFLKAFGSNWPQDKLERLALFAYTIDNSSWDYRRHTDADPAETLEFELTAFKGLMESCFD